MNVRRWRLGWEGKDRIHLTHHSCALRVRVQCDGLILEVGNWALEDMETSDLGW